jgi:hypothetical protein
VTSNNIPQDHRRHPAPFPLAEAQQLRQQNYSYHRIAAEIGWSFAQVRCYLIAHRDGRSAPESATSAPDDSSPRTLAHHQCPTSALDLSDLDQRLRVVEAFITTLQRHPAYLQPSERTSALPAHQRTTRQWLKRGTHLATDMAEALHRYAQQHGLEVRKVHDRALRHFFAQAHGEEAEE